MYTHNVGDSTLAECRRPCTYSKGLKVSAFVYVLHHLLCQAKNVHLLLPLVHGLKLFSFHQLQRDAFVVEVSAVRVLGLTPWKKAHVLERLEAVGCDVQSNADPLLEGLRRRRSLFLLRGHHIVNGRGSVCGALVMYAVACIWRAAKIRKPTYIVCTMLPHTHMQPTAGTLCITGCAVVMMRKTSPDSTGLVNIYCGE